MMQHWQSGAKAHNKRLHTERQHTLFVVQQTPLPSGEAHDVRHQGEINWFKHLCSYA
jgi:hypothetical protein